MVLTPENAVARVNFAQANLQRDWSTVIFSDEKVFSSSNDCTKVLWRRNKTRYENHNILPTRRSGRITCGFWGWICGAGPGEIVAIPGRLDANGYRDILEEVFLPSARVLFPEGNIHLVQDNSPIHTARTVRNWFDNHPEIIVIPWPSKSPDLNIIENMWGLMVRNFGDDGNLRTMANLQQNVRDVWENQRGTNYCARLVDSMPRRLQSCIDNLGYYTKY